MSDVRCCDQNSFIKRQCLRGENHVRVDRIVACHWLSLLASLSPEFRRQTHR